MSDPRRGRMKLIALAVLFAAPLATAWLWFANVDRGAPAGSVAKGELIAPARPLGAFELAGVDGGAAVTDRTLDGRWTLVHVGGSRCDDACRDTLWAARQVHTRLGRDAVRVQRLYLVVGADGVDDAAYFATEHAGMLLARVASADAAFGVLDQGSTYLIDPLGNLMMRYAPETTPKDLLDDLKRLLRVSRIG